MSTARGQDESYEHARAVARDVRETVADQLHDLVVERDGLGTHSELVGRVSGVGAAGRKVAEARGRQRQAEELGLALAPHVRAEQEALEMLRQAVMSLGEACGSYVVALDVDLRRHGTALEGNGRRRRQSEEERI